MEKFRPKKNLEQPKNLGHGKKGHGVRNRDRNIMWPIIMGAARAYAPYIVFPVAVAVGTVGYLIESRLADQERGKVQAPSTLDARGDRQLDTLVANPTEVNGLREKKDIPKSVLDRNLKPGTYSTANG